MSIAEARRCFFSYFDATYEKVRLAQAKRFVECCEALPPPHLRAL
jgi:hypothetical protein